MMLFSLFFLFFMLFTCNLNSYILVILRNSYEKTCHSQYSTIPINHFLIVALSCWMWPGEQTVLIKLACYTYVMWCTGHTASSSIVSIQRLLQYKLSPDASETQSIALKQHGKPRSGKKKLALKKKPDSNGEPSSWRLLCKGRKEEGDSQTLYLYILKS